MKTSTNLRSVLLLLNFLFLTIPVISSAIVPLKDTAVKTGGIRGKVLDHTTKKPIEFALITIRQNNLAKASTYTDEKGEFRVTGLIAGMYSLIAQEACHKHSQVNNIEVVDTEYSYVQLTMMDRSYEVQACMIAYRPPVKRAFMKLRTRALQSFTKSPPPQSSVIADYSGKRNGTKRDSKKRSDPDGEENTESYAHFEDNPFFRPDLEPLSTFSMDVDAASYSNIRRYLNAGSLPPAGAVRLEELINYFPYASKKSDSRDAFSVQHEFSDCPWNDNAKLLRILIKGREVDADTSMAQNLVFLIDVSGSMEAENKLPLVQRSLNILVDKLRDKDRIAIVVYAGSSGLVLPSTKGSSKSVIRDAIERLRAGGSTAGADGIKLAYKIAVQNFIANGNNRIILATDGDFNVGVSSDDELVKLIEEKRKEKVFLTVLGFGMGNYKDSKLELLADKGNGNYFYIDNYKEAQKVFDKELASTLIVIAKDVKLQLEFNPETVSEYRLIGYENRILENQDFNNDLKDAGEIGAGKTVVALYEIVLRKKLIKDENGDSLRYQTVLSKGIADELLTVSIRYKEPDQDFSKKIVIPLSLKSLPLKETSKDFRFSAAIAQFGMLLRNSPYKGTSDYTNTIRLAKEGRGEDEEGYREEFIELIKIASRLSIKK